MIIKRQLSVPLCQRENVCIFFAKVCALLGKLTILDVLVTMLVPKQRTGKQQTIFSAPVNMLSRNKRQT